MQLWNREYPHQLAYQKLSELDKYLADLKNPQYYILLDENDLAGWSVSFDRDNERWFAIIISSEHQGKGIGSKMMRALMDDNPKLSGWVTDHDDYKRYDGQTYPSPLPFYLKFGFRVIDSERLETDLLSAVKVMYP